MQPVLTPDGDGRGRPAHDRGRHSGRGPDGPGAAGRWRGRSVGGSDGRRAYGVGRSCAARATTGATAWLRRGSCGVGAHGSTCLRVDDGCRPGCVLRARRCRADVVVDAMYGTGFRGELDGDALHRARRRSADFRGLVVAVDIPSGVDGLTGAVQGTAVRADWTVAFAALKPGCCFEPGRSLAGRGRGRRHRDRASTTRTASVPATFVTERRRRRTGWLPAAGPRERAQVGGRGVRRRRFGRDDRRARRSPATPRCAPARGSCGAGFPGPRPRPRLRGPR